MRTSPQTFQSLLSSPLTVKHYTCNTIESILYMTFWGAKPEYPSIFFAQIPILIFKEKTKLWILGVFLSNFILFLSYHSDQIPQPRMRAHNFRHFCFFTRPNHWMLKLLHRLWRAAKRPHHPSISLQPLQANLHVKRMWEFDSISRLQKGQAASWGLMIPFSTRWSLVFSLSRFANHKDSFALGGINFCHTMLMIGLDRHKV